MSRLARFAPELAFALLFVVCAVFVAARFRVDGSMATLLPPASQKAARLAREVIDSSVSRGMILSVGAEPMTEESKRRSRSVAKTLAVALSEGTDDRDGTGDTDGTNDTDGSETNGTARHFAFVSAGPTANFESTVYETYFPRRLQFVTSDTTKLDEAFGEAALRERVRSLKRDLSSSSGFLFRQLAPEDPLGLFKGRLDAFERAGSGLQVEDGQFVASDGHALVFLGLTSSALDGERQSAVLETLERRFRDAKGDFDDVTLEMSGVNVFAVDTEQRVKRDMMRVLAVSVLGIVLLFVVLFRSVLSLLLASLPLLFGWAVGTTACLLAFGQVHALTLAFGASLLGVSIDYPVHVMNHVGLSSSRALPSSVRRGLLLGMCTTVMGIAALAFSGFVVMVQAALFAGAGLIGAAALSLFVLPRYAGVGRSGTRRWLSRNLLGIITAKRTRAIGLGLGGVLGMVGALGVATASWDTSLEGLAPMAPALKAEDQRVRARAGAPDTSLLVITEGRDPQQALRRNDAVAAVLEKAQEEGLLRSFRSLNAFVWSEELQRKNFDAAKREAFGATVMRVLDEEGFAPKGFAPFRQQLRDAMFQPLNPAHLDATALRRITRGFLLEKPEHTLVVTYVNPTSQQAEQSLQQRLASVEGSTLINQRRMLDAAYSELRGRVRWSLILGSLLMCCLLAVRFRRVRLVAASALPALISPIVGLGVVALSGQSLNLFHLFAALVVMSMAMDYGIFVVETAKADDSEELGATLCSIVIAALTTSLSFGLLGFSSLPVLQGIGQTTAVGIAVALLLTPLSLWLLHGSGQRKLHNGNAVQ